MNDLCTFEHGVQGLLFESSRGGPSARDTVERSHMTAEATSAPLPGKLVALAPEPGDPLPHQIANRHEPGII